jgi:hypothetical protein
MCPECFATIALLVTGAVSTSGIAAFFVRIFRRKPHPQKFGRT